MRSRSFCDLALSPFCTYAHAAAVILRRRRIPERVVVGHRRAPVGHGAFGIRFLDLLKLREGPRVPEVVEKSQGAIELRPARRERRKSPCARCRHLRSRGRVARADPWRQARHEPRGGAAAQHPSTISIDRRHDGLLRFRVMRILTPSTFVTPARLRDEAERRSWRAPTLRIRPSGSNRRAPASHRCAYNPCIPCN